MVIWDYLSNENEEDKKKPPPVKPMAVANDWNSHS
jgi:hypothetical protein